MLRLSLLLVAVALAAGSVGCTHCDTCDDFPIPCVGSNCGPISGQPIGSYTPAGVVGVPFNGPMTPMPAPTSANALDAEAPAPAMTPGSELPPAPSLENPSTAPSTDDKATTPALELPSTTPAPAPGGDAPAAPAAAPSPNSEATTSTPPSPPGPEGAPGSGS